MHHESTSAGAPAPPDDDGEVVGPPQALVCCEHGQPRFAAQAERRSRPLARRVEMMARPARVRMRSRKPWVFARRRLFGWNVRLLTVDAFRTVARSRAAPTARELRIYRAVPRTRKPPPVKDGVANPLRVLGALAAFQTTTPGPPQPVTATG